VDNSIELISDGDGLAVIGDPTNVERFLESAGLPSKDLGLSRLGGLLNAGGAIAKAGSEIASHSGRWVQLTQESADVVKQYGLMPSKTPGVSHAMVGQPGDIQQWIQIVTGPGSMLTNPAVLAGAAGIMAQLAMKQSMAEITDYLARIDEKVDAVLRAQTNQVLARLDGVDLAIREAMSVRETVGRVSDVTWSKVQNTSGTILETQGYALRQLSDLAAKIEQQAKVGDLAKTGKEAEADVQKWLAVLARCFQLQDAIAVLELERVLDDAPDELDGHRLGLKAARRDRLELISNTTERLLAGMNAAVGTANAKVLLHPTSSPSVVGSSNQIAIDVHDFNGLLGIESGRQSSEAARWMDAASERWDKVRETGAGGIDTAKRIGSETRGHAKSMKDKLSNTIAERTRRARKMDGDPAE
jgi:hypothetical protein